MRTREEIIHKRANELYGDTSFDEGTMDAVIQWIQHRIDSNKETIRGAEERIKRHEKENEDMTWEKENVRILRTVNEHLCSLVTDFSVLKTYKQT